tara:strand:- start:200 stop:577 length:378 start_codon:yes stop_codon:yes gene_type:complete
MSNSYFDKMFEILNEDIVKKIILYINIDIIKKQKKLKKELNIQIKEYKNVFYNDKNYLIYRNLDNNLILKNKKNNLSNYKLIKLNKNTSNYDFDNNNTSNIIINNDSNIIMNNLNNNIKIIVKYL